jgi:hypothetical protein
MVAGSLTVEKISAQGLHIFEKALLYVVSIDGQRMLFCSDEHGEHRYCGEERCPYMNLDATGVTTPLSSWFCPLMRKKM